MAIKKTSAKITPKSNIKALLNPLVALVSKRTKNTGPIVNDSKIPKGIAAKILSNIGQVFFYKNKKIIPI
jgi:hypothetical protein